MASSNPIQFQKSKEELQPQTSRQPRPSVTPTATSSNNESQSPNSKPSPIKRDHPLSHRYQPPQPSDTATTSSDKIEIRPIQEIQPQSIIDNLFKKVMEENWDAVILIYKDHKDVVQTAKITRAKETALHVAVSTGKQNVVKELLHNIDSNQIVMMTNDRGENPLHLAASLGQVEICRWIVAKDEELIGMRNENGETPLFLAALHGKKEAFYALHPKCPLDDSHYIKHEVMDCRRNDGDTILHAAISAEYFELAFQIITWYPELIEFHNEKGHTALHFLAHNPSTFKSGCHFGPLDNFIYHCFIINPIKVEKPSNDVAEHQSDTPAPVLENYETCSDLLQILINVMVHHVRRWKTENVKDAANKLLRIHTSKHPKQDVEAHDPKNGGKQSTKCKRSHIEVKDTPGEASDDHMSTSRPPYPTNYYTFFRFLRLTLELFLFIFGIGFFKIHKIKEKKRKHTRTLQVMMKLIIHSEQWKYVDDGLKPTGLVEKEIGESPPNESHVTSNQDAHTKQRDQQPSQDIRESKIKKIISEMKGKKIQVEADKIRDVYTLKMLSMDSGEEGEKKSSPFLLAAKMGVKEMVQEILKVFPVAIWDEDEDKKNVVLLVVENRHPKIFNLLLKKCPPTKNESAYKKVDKDGNSALHLAATIGKNHPWRISGAALQMQWEFMWYKFIKSSLPRHFFMHRNLEHKTAKEVFADTHKEMIKDGGKWLTNTSISCSVVAVLIATVACASATTVPGGPKEGTGIPNLRGQPAFEIFTLSSLAAFCLSVTSLTMFLSILTSRYHVSDFLHNLPRKLILGLTSLFISIAAMSVAFCAGHYYTLGDKLRHNALTIYAITCLPVAISTVAQLPLYFDLIKSTITSVPEQSYEFPSI